jgi:UPF0271 protein
MLIDLNCDLGEGSRTDADLLPLITSANVSCGCHAGTPGVILTTLELAAKHGVTVGAHPGYRDREHFGRRELRVPRRDLVELIHSQIVYLRALAESAGVQIKYVKPHGALYNQACREDAYAEPVIAACELFGLPIVGLPGSRLQERAIDRVPFFAEGFADRRYRADGSLVPREQPGAFVENPREAVEQVRRLIADQGIQTICIHGDNPGAVGFVRAVREELLRTGAELRPFA